MNSLSIEHGSTRAGRWLRMRRLRLALWIALIEGLLVIFHVIPKWPALLVAALVLAFYLFLGRNLRSDVARHASWVAAASQAFVAMIPVLLAFLGFAAIVAIAVLAGIALIALLGDRR
jgi:hypothetical protein